MLSTSRNEHAQRDSLSNPKQGISTMKSSITRREMLQTLGAGALAAPLLLSSGQSLASDALPQLDLNDPLAKALGYVHDTTKADAVKYKQHKPEQLCVNCKLVQGEAKEWMPCQLFPGKAVHMNGWCVGYVVKA